MFNWYRKRKYKKALNHIVTQHMKWLQSPKNGERLLLVDQDLTGAVFSGSTMDKAIFDGCRMDHASFSEAHMYKAEFKKTLFTDVRFVGAIFSNPLIVGGHFRYAQFREVSMLNSMFHMSDLSFSDFAGTKFRESDLSQAILRKCKWNIHGHNAQKEELYDLKEKFYPVVDECITVLNGYSNQEIWKVIMSLKSLSEKLKFKKGERKNEPQPKVQALLREGSIQPRATED